MSVKESDKVVERYSRRVQLRADDRYSLLNPSVLKGVQERQRVLIQLLRQHANNSLDQLSVLEVGCGSGGNLLELLRMGFDPENLSANELLPERVAVAKKNLPTAINLHVGDATQLGFSENSFDIVYQSTVFSSLLDANFQQNLADQMWRWVKPGGGVLWYDFTFDNPNNRDVKGVPVSRIKELFPDAQIDVRRVTLAPPISRRVCKVHPALYGLFNVLPLLRTHVICWVGKA